MQCAHLSAQSGRNSRRFSNASQTLKRVVYELLPSTFSASALSNEDVADTELLLCSYHAYALFRPCFSRGTAIAVTAVSQLILIYTLMRVLPPWPGVPEPPSPGLFPLRIAVLRTGVLGVCVIGILAGFGTVAFPYSVLRAFVVPVNPYEVKALQTQLGLIREQV